jgi:hypothetical protein
MISFVTYFSSTRLSNLLQTIRFLEKRENLLLDGELVIVCQDRCPSISTNFKSYKHFNLELDEYRKPYMCNFGIRNATHETIALIDSDRILPHNYFHKSLQLLKPNMAITATNLYRLEKPYTDQEIELGNTKRKPDFKSVLNEGGCKNLFAGNTLMKKSDYLKWGGMDEEFVGYGFADMDMTTSAINQGCVPLYLKEEELHLYHQRDIRWEGKPISSDTFRIITATNALRYCIKWGTTPDEKMKEILKKVDDHIDDFPTSLREEYESKKIGLKREISVI